MPRLTEDDLRDWSDHIGLKLVRVRDLYHQLRVRHRLDAMDGYPTSSLPGHSSPTNDKDDDGTPLPARPSDPTATIAVARITNPESDPIWRVLESIERAVLECGRSLAACEGRALKILAPPKEVPVPKGGCRSCDRVGAFNPEYCKGLCQWCYDHQTPEGLLPPRGALDVLHRQGPRQASAWVARERGAA